jgi:hypothetical protein
VVSQASKRANSTPKHVRMAAITRVQVADGVQLPGEQTLASASRALAAALAARALDVTGAHP